METPFDYLTTKVNGVSLSDAYKLGFEAGEQVGIRKVADWVQSFAVMGGTLSVKDMMDTMEAHSPYKKYLWHDQGEIDGS